MPVPQTRRASATLADAPDGTLAMKRAAMTGEVRTGAFVSLN